MTAVELERIARSIIPPVGATMAIARVDDQLKHRAAFLIDGRIHDAPVGPAFDRPRDAIRLVKLLNGETPRPGQSDSAVLGSTPSGDEAGQTEAPDLGQALTLGLADATAGTCAGCGGPLPPGRHGPATPHLGPDTDGATANLTPSRPAPG